MADFLMKMPHQHFLAVGPNCAVNFNILETLCSKEQAMEILKIKLRCKIFRVDLITLARAFKGMSRYEYGADPNMAPYTTDCSSFVQFLYGQFGFHIPRISKHQFDFLPFTVTNHDALKAGDLIFTTSTVNWGEDPDTAIGHVGIVTGEGTVIHSQQHKKPFGIVEDPLDRFTENLRGIGRLVPHIEDYHTIVSPDPNHPLFGYSQEVESYLQRYIGTALKQ